MAWTIDSIREFAPDAGTFERGSKIERSDWNELGGDGRLIWGSCAGSRGSLYDVKIELPNRRARCGCPARQKPCKHAISLLLAFVDSPATFGVAPQSKRSDVELLEQARACLEAVRGKDEQALSKALELWQGLALSSPVLAAELAPAVEELGRRGSKGLADPQAWFADPEAWFDAVQVRDPHALTRLLEGIEVKRNELAVAQISALASWPDDPRLSGYLCGLLETMRVLRSEAAAPFWVSAFHLLARIPDYRTLTLLESLGDKHRRQLGVYAGSFMHDKIDVVRDELRARYAGGAEPSAEVASMVGELVGVVCPGPSRAVAEAASSAEELLAAVFADPADDHARSVYADLLVELGDPRGEFINLQLARSQGTQSKDGAKREKELLKKHRDEWMGTLMPYILKKDLAFERGFIDTVRYHYERRYREKDTIDDRLWSTVRVLYEARAELALDARLKSLREVELSADRGLPALAEQGTVRSFNRLVVSDNIEAAISGVVANAALLPELTALEIIGNLGTGTEVKSASELEPLIASDLFKQLRGLTLRGRIGALGEIIEAIAPHGHIEAFVFWSDFGSEGNWFFELGSKKARFDTLDGKFKAGDYGGYVDRIHEALDSCDPSRFSSVTIASRSKPHETAMPAIAEALARFKDVKKTKFPKGWG